MGIYFVNATMKNAKETRGRINLEIAVMKLLLAGNTADLEILRRQFEAATVESRKDSGYGFFVAYHVPEAISRLPENRSFSFGDVAAEIDGLKHGAGFVLFVKDGAISMLEAYSYDELWPESITNFSLRYHPGPEKDLESLVKKWRSDQ